MSSLAYSEYTAIQSAVNHMNGGGQGSGSVPVGTMLMYVSATPPDKTYAPCDGRTLSRTAYSDLFAVIATAFGAGDGSTTFNLPNMTDKLPIGVGAIAASIGATGGSSSITITNDNMPSHSHPITDKTHAHGITDGGHSHTLTAVPNRSGNSYNISGSEWFASQETSITTAANTTGIVINSASTGITTTEVSPAPVAPSINVMNPYCGIQYIIKILPTNVGDSIAV
jgi:microcystin-dependent protein